MNDSSPGPYKVFQEVFSLFWKILCFYMLSKLNSELLNNFQESVIKLIPKSNELNKSVNDYRPISLTNYDYRIFTKFLP
jgi:hypothetical protein